MKGMTSMFYLSKHSKDNHQPTTRRDVILIISAMTWLASNIGAGLIISYFYGG